MKKIIQKAPKPGGWKPKEHGWSKLWLKMPDGQTDIRYSLDWRGAFSSLRDQSLGIERLKAWISRPQFKGHEIAIIYDRETNAQLFMSRNGQIIKDESTHGN